MSNLGVFGATVVEELAKHERWRLERKACGRQWRGAAAGAAVRPSAARDGMARCQSGPRGGMSPNARCAADKSGDDRPATAAQPTGVEPTVRKNFADTAFWAASLTTDKDGIAEVGSTCRRT